MLTVFLRRINNDRKKDVLKLQSEAKKRERTLKSTELETKQVSIKLRGAKSASTNLKRQLRENDENVNQRDSPSLAVFINRIRKLNLADILTNNSNCCNLCSQ